jgi:hypothetical protein
MFKKLLYVMFSFSFIFNGMIVKTLYIHKFYVELGMLVFITIIEIIINVTRDHK